MISPSSDNLYINFENNFLFGFIQVFRNNKYFISYDMNNFSREYLFQEVVLHRHCILLNLSENILWDGNRKVDKIYMIDYCLAPSAQEQMLANITKGVNTYGAIEIKAFTDKENPTDAKKITIISDIINEIEIWNYT